MSATSAAEERARKFFDDFVVAFASFDGTVIARRYRVPYLAQHVGRQPDLFTDQVAIADYFQTIVDRYHAAGARSCTWRDMQVVALGRESALATVTWDLLDETGGKVSSWRESYTLALDGNVFRVFGSIDHA